MNSVIKGASYVLVHTPDMVYIQRNNTDNRKSCESGFGIFKSSTGASPFL